MSMITRYKRPGGFLQLLCLIETFGKQKQEKFLAMIREENAVWAEALEKRLITIDRMFSWPAPTLGEIMNRIPVKNLAVALHGLSDDRKDLLFSLISHAEKRKLEGFMNEENPSEGEVTASLLKLIEATREMLKSSVLRIDQTDSEMSIPENIEEKLAEASLSGVLDSSSSSHSALEVAEQFPKASKDLPSKNEVVPPRADHSNRTSESVDLLHHKLLILQKENQALKLEVKNLKEKLSHIKKLAA